MRDSVLARAIQAFVMYCVNGTSCSSLLIESTDSMIYIIESVDSISRDDPDSPLTHYITNGISHARYTITLFKHNHRVSRLISNRISVYITSLLLLLLLLLSLLYIPN